jgi:secondary thiamine-phosphate synthase enzyme
MMKRGLTLVAAMHITASVFINDDESGLHQEYEKWLEGLAPHAPIRQYRHNDTGEDNADAHLKRQVMGREVLVAVTSGRLDFGTWERILGVSHLADTGVLTAAGGSGCWSRLSGSRSAQGHHVAASLHMNPYPLPRNWKHRTAQG